ncbi:hypothetical protein COM13_24495 [Bacillus pseudomycoides]|uniref:hypothetical protein n=1 Tax=Bacillus TaxID=1386 RepID=UPI000BEB7015|nr:MULTISPECIES: hypothetical protein [Bacillus]MCX2826120.1 hypothetical protein [Bacillus sp. DHT2]MDR4913763.1 hypothetical protein [Bacillus pseudomycoides]PDX97138.1 hypothetical protein COO07_29210 [Bacillus pseudomycoides]PEB42362.1 hypothetical protein COO06_07505 [Bacillus pseudomycoides]PEK74214.1 hypothetical protein CN597_26415 [Bacillus pseudomycoides]
MFMKRKLPILTFLALIFSLIVTVFPTNSAYAAEDDRILDIYGDPITTNKDYIIIDKYLRDPKVPLSKRIAPVGYNRLGVTYEKFAGWHYVIQYKKSSYYGAAELHKDTKGNEYYGTPINFEAPAGVEGDGYVRNNTPITMSMWIGGPNADAGGIKKYVNAGNRSWIYFSDQSRSNFTVKKVNSKEINLVAGKTDYLRDKLGRPTDWYNADEKQSSYGVTTVFQLNTSDQPFADQNKEWGRSAPENYAGYELVPLQ